MTKVKGFSKKGQYLMRRYDNMRGKTLSDIYKTWSNKKQEAFDECRAKFEADENARNFKIDDGGSYFFVAAWETIMDNEYVINYETYANTYIVRTGLYINVF